MIQYNPLLLDDIESEKNGTDFCYPEEDKAVLQEMLGEINQYAGTDFHYLAELNSFNIHGSGEIMVRYIHRFLSEWIRAIIIWQLVSDKLKDCDKLTLQMYLHFKASDEYISEPGCSDPAHIYVTYDNAIRKLKPKRLKKDLLELARNPRDAFYLPFTMRMLASWKMPEMKDILISYASPESITAQDVGLKDSEKPYFPSLDYIKRELIFTAIDGLKYYPSPEVRDVITSFEASADKDIQSAAKRTLKVLTK